MKKRLLLIVCCVLILVLCATALISCKKDDAIDEATLESLLQSAKGGYAETATIKDNFTVSGTVSSFDDEKDEMIKVNIKWTPSVTSVTATEADGTVTVAIPASRTEDLTFTLTATLVDADGNAYKRADGTEYSFTITRTAVATNPALEAQTKFYNSIITAPQVGTDYKLAVFKQYTAWYFNGTGQPVTRSSDRFATTLDYAQASTVQLEASDEAGKYYISFMDGTTKKYLDLYVDATTYTTGQAKLVLRTEKSAVVGLFSIHETGALTTTTTSNGTTFTYFLCMRNSYVPDIYAYDEKSLHGDSWKTADSALVIVSENMSYTPETWVADETTVLAKAFALAENDEIAARVSLTGTVTRNDSTNVTIQVADKEIVCYLLVGRDNVKVGDKIKVTGVIQNHKKDAATDAVVEFLAGCTYEMVKRAPVEVPTNVDKVTTPVADTAYLIATNQENLVKQIYLLTEMNGYYVKTTESRFDGVKFYVEAADGGHKIYYMSGADKKYLGVTTNGTHVNLTLETETVWTIDADGIHVTIGEGAAATEYYMGTYGTNTTLGMNKDSDTLWKSFLGTLTEEASKATITATQDENATVAVDKQIATIGETVTITITPKNDYTIGKVYVNGKEISAVEGVYSFVVAGNSTVSVDMNDPSGVAPKGTTAENPYTVAEARAIALALEGAASSTSVYDAKPTYVKGYVVSISAQNDFYIADTIGGTSTLEFYKGILDEGVTGTIYINDEVVLYGYITNYSKGYKCELATNNEVTPLVKSITTGNATIAQATSEDYTIAFSKASGANGDKVTFTIAVNAEGKEVQTVTVTNGAATYNEENSNYEVTLNGNMVVTVELKVAGSKEEKIVIDLSKTDSGISTTQNSGEVKTVTLSGVECEYFNCKQNSGYIMVYGDTDETKCGYITGSVNGTIKSIKFTTGSGASPVTNYIVIFSATKLEGAQTGTTTNVSNGGTGEFTCEVDNASYFYIGVATKGTNNKKVNGQIVTIEIVYEPAEAEADAE